MAKWQEIGTAGSLNRVIVAGWQPTSGSTRGYWWFYEDMTDGNGIPIDHPDATKWQDFPAPPEEPGGE